MKARFGMMRNHVVTQRVLYRCPIGVALGLMLSACMSFPVTAPTAAKVEDCLAAKRGLCSRAESAKYASDVVIRHSFVSTTAAPAGDDSMRTTVTPGGIDLYTADSVGKLDEIISMRRGREIGSLAPLEQMCARALPRIRAGVAAMSPDELSSAGQMTRDGIRFVGHPVQQQLNSLHTSLRTASANDVVSLNKSDVMDYISLAYKISMQDGWKYGAAAGVFNLCVEANSPAETRGPGYSTRLASRAADAGNQLFLEAYFRAYFRNGEFVKISAALANLYTQYPELVPYKDTLQPIIDELSKNGTIGKVGTDGLVTRTGQTFQFPPLQITVDPTQKKWVSISTIDAATVGSDVVRVALEALFDAASLLPAVSNATGITITDASAGILGLEDIANVTQGTAISADQFTSSNQIANTVDGAAGSIAGQVIRGLNVAALNNEALAKIVEAMVAVTARKVTEKVTYCWYACGGTGTEAQTPLRGIARPLSGTHTVTVKLNLL